MSVASPTHPPLTLEAGPSAPEPAAPEPPAPEPPAPEPPPRRLRVVPAPSWEPPGRAPRPRVPLPPAAGATQGTLALAFVLPSGLPAEPQTPDLVVVPAPRRPWLPEDVDDEPPDFTHRAELPDPRLWAARLCQAVLEVLAGGRPVTQLLRWTSFPVYTCLAEQRPSPGSRHLLARGESVRSVHVCEPADGVAEVALVVAGPDRPRAVALRLEGLNGRWVCTQLQLG